MAPSVAMTDEYEICRRCGLPIGRAPSEGPLWTPQVKGVEVCGCAPELDQERAQAAAIREDVHKLEAELEELRKRH